jgi:hypothetical protein
VPIKEFETASLCCAGDDGEASVLGDELPVVATGEQAATERRRVMARARVRGLMLRQRMSAASVTPLAQRVPEPSRVVSQDPVEEENRPTYK